MWDLVLPIRTRCSCLVLRACPCLSFLCRVTGCRSLSLTLALGAAQNHGKHHCTVSHQALRASAGHHQGTTPHTKRP
jgi:hypothetical protein